MKLVCAEKKETIGIDLAKPGCDKTVIGLIEDGKIVPTNSNLVEFACELRGLTDRFIHETLVRRQDLAVILREEADIIEQNREHEKMPSLPKIEEVKLPYCGMPGCRKVLNFMHGIEWLNRWVPWYCKK